jgi:hypothetical protein
MDEQELHRHITLQLSKQGNRNDLIKEVCEITGLQWYEARRMVEDISYECSREIARKRFPIIFAIGLVTAAVGMVIIYIGIARIYDPLVRLIARPDGINPREIISLIMQRPEVMDYSILGLGIIAGASWGIGWALAPLFK